MKYLIRKEFATSIGWKEVFDYYNDRDECFKEVKASLRDRSLMRIYVYESIDPELWRDKKLDLETLHKIIVDK